MHPFERRLTKFRTNVIVAGIWLAAFAVSGVQMHVARAERFRHNGEWLWSCEERWAAPLYGQVYTVVIFTVTFAVPLLALGFTYSSIVLRMWLRVSPGNAHPGRDMAQLRAKRKVIKMLVIIVLLFALCWLPLQMFVLLYYFVPSFGTYRTDHERKVYALTYVACHWLANANSLVNPFVYCFMSENFRADLKELLTLRERSDNPEAQPRDSLRSNSTRATICLVQRVSSGSSTNRRLGNLTTPEPKSPAPTSSVPQPGRPASPSPI